MNKSSSSVITKVYNGYLNTMDQLGHLGDIPQALQSAYKVEILNLESNSGLYFRYSRSAWEPILESDQALKT